LIVLHRGPISSFLHFARNNMSDQTTDPATADAPPLANAAAGTPPPQDSAATPPAEQAITEPTAANNATVGTPGAVTPESAPAGAPGAVGGQGLTDDPGPRGTPGEPGISAEKADVDGKATPAADLAQATGTETPAKIDSLVQSAENTAEVGQATTAENAEKTEPVVQAAGNAGEVTQAADAAPTLEEQVAALQAALNAANANAEVLTATIGDQNLLIVQLRADNASLGTQLTEMTAKLTEATTNLEKASVELTDVKADLADATEVAQDEVDALVDRLQAQIDAFRARASAIQAQGTEKRIRVFLNRDAVIANVKHPAGKTLALVALQPGVSLNYLCDAIRHQFAQG
jgi:hypothetical protein